MSQVIYNINTGQITRVIYDDSIPRNDLSLNDFEDVVITAETDDIIGMSKVNTVTKKLAPKELIKLYINGFLCGDNNEIKVGNSFDLQMEFVNGETGERLLVNSKGDQSDQSIASEFWIYNSNVEGIGDLIASHKDFIAKDGVFLPVNDGLSRVNIVLPGNHLIYILITTACSVKLVRVL